MNLHLRRLKIYRRKVATMQRNDDENEDVYDGEDDNEPGEEDEDEDTPGDGDEAAENGNDDDNKANMGSGKIITSKGLCFYFVSLHI